MKDLISASILSADFAHLKDECDAVLAAGSDMIHFDVMDHHFVPNLSFGAVVCDSLKKAGIQAPIDVHLMVENPEQYIEPFAKAGADILTIHPQTTKNVKSCLEQIKNAGMKAGLAFNPDTPFVVEHPELIDLILIMSVYPGFGGQSFIADTLNKAKQARELADRSDHDIIVSIDGGINETTIKQAQNAGCNCFVMGSAIFKTDDYQGTISQLRTILK